MQRKSLGLIGVFLFSGLLLAQVDSISEQENNKKVSVKGESFALVNNQFSINIPRSLWQEIANSGFIEFFQADEKLRGWATFVPPTGPELIESLDQAGVLVPDGISMACTDSTFLTALNILRWFSHLRLAEYDLAQATSSTFVQSYKGTAEALQALANLRELSMEWGLRFADPQGAPQLYKKLSLLETYFDEPSGWILDIDEQEARLKISIRDFLERKRTQWSLSLGLDSMNTRRMDKFLDWTVVAKVQLVDQGLYVRLQTSQGSSADVDQLLDQPAQRFDRWLGRLSGRRKLNTFEAKWSLVGLAKSLQAELNIAKPRLDLLQSAAPILSQYWQLASLLQTLAPGSLSMQLGSSSKLRIWSVPTLPNLSRNIDLPRDLEKVPMLLRLFNPRLGSILGSDLYFLRAMVRWVDDLKLVVDGGAYHLAWRFKKPKSIRQSLASLGSVDRYQRAIEWLVQAQLEDGSWPVVFATPKKIATSALALRAIERFDNHEGPDASTSLVHSVLEGSHWLEQQWYDQRWQTESNLESSWASFILCATPGLLQRELSDVVKAKLIKRIDLAAGLYRRDSLDDPEWISTTLVMLALEKSSTSNQQVRALRRSLPSVMASANIVAQKNYGLSAASLEILRHYTESSLRFEVFQNWIKRLDDPVDSLRRDSVFLLLVSYVISDLSLPAPVEFRRILRKLWLKRQHENGGWGRGNSSDAWTTSAALISLDLLAIADRSLPSSKFWSQQKRPSASFIKQVRRASSYLREHQAQTGAWQHPILSSEAVTSLVLAALGRQDRWGAIDQKVKGPNKPILDPEQRRLSIPTFQLTAHKWLARISIGTTTANSPTARSIKFDLNKFWNKLGERLRAQHLRLEAFPQQIEMQGRAAGLWLTMQRDRQGFVVAGLKGERQFDSTILVNFALKRSSILEEAHRFTTSEQLLSEMESYFLAAETKEGRGKSLLSKEARRILCYLSLDPRTRWSTPSPLLEWQQRLQAKADRLSDDYFFLYLLSRASITAGVQAPPKFFAELRVFLLALQNEDGGWGPDGISDPWSTAMLLLSLDVLIGSACRETQ